MFRSFQPHWGWPVRGRLSAHTRDNNPRTTDNSRSSIVRHRAASCTANVASFFPCDGKGKKPGCLSVTRLDGAQRWLPWPTGTDWRCKPRSSRPRATSQWPTHDLDPSCCTFTPSPHAPSAFYVKRGPKQAHRARGTPLYTSTESPLSATVSIPFLFFFFFFPSSARASKRTPLSLSLFLLCYFSFFISSARHLSFCPYVDASAPRCYGVCNVVLGHRWKIPGARRESLNEERGRESRGLFRLFFVETEATFRDFWWDLSHQRRRWWIRAMLEGVKLGERIFLLFCSFSFCGVWFQENVINLWISIYGRC